MPKDVAYRLRCALVGTGIAALMGAPIGASYAASSQDIESDEPQYVELVWRTDGTPNTFDWRFKGHKTQFSPGETTSQELMIVNRGPSAGRVTAEIFVVDHNVPASELAIWEHLRINGAAFDPSSPVIIAEELLVPNCPAETPKLQCPQIPLPIDFEFVKNPQGTPGNLYGAGNITVKFNLRLTIQGLPDVGENEVELWEINALPEDERFDENTGTAILHEDAPAFIVAEVAGEITPVTVDLAQNGTLTPQAWLPGFTPVDIMNISNMVRTGELLPLCVDAGNERVETEYGYTVYNYKKLTCDTQLTVRHTVRSLNVDRVPGMEPVHPDDFDMNLHRVAGHTADSDYITVNESEDTRQNARRRPGEPSISTVSVLNTITYALTAQLPPDQFPHDSWAVRLAELEAYDPSALPAQFHSDGLVDHHGSLFCESGTEEWSDGEDGTVTVLFGYDALCDTTAHSSYLNVQTFVMDNLGNLIDNATVAQNWSVQLYEVFEGQVTPIELSVPEDWMTANEQFIKVRPGAEIRAELVPPTDERFDGWTAIRHDLHYDSVGADVTHILPSQANSGLGNNRAAGEQPGTELPLQIAAISASGQAATMPSNEQFITDEPASDGAIDYPVAAAATVDCPDAIQVHAETLQPETAHQITFVVRQPKVGEEIPQCDGDPTIIYPKPDPKDPTGPRDWRNPQSPVRKPNPSGPNYGPAWRDPVTGLPIGEENPSAKLAQPNTSWLTRTGASFGLLAIAAALAGLGTQANRNRDQKTRLL